MSRRGRGEGSVHFDADRGRGVAVLDLGTDPDTGKRVRRKVTAGSKTAARDRLDDLKIELRQAGTVAPRDYTVAALMRGLGRETSVGAALPHLAAGAPPVRRPDH